MSDLSDATDKPNKEPSLLAKTHHWLISPAGRFVRYVIVLLIVITAIVGFFNQWFNMCEVVTSDTNGVTRTCGGPDLTSASVLAAVFLVLLLLWPDLSEFSAFGVTLKKLVEKVEETVTETDRTVGRIELQAATIDRTTSSTSDIANDLRSDLREIRGALQAIAEQGSSVTERRGFTVAPGVVSRWDRQDQSSLEALCVAILGSDDLKRADAELRGHESSLRKDLMSDLLGREVLEAPTAPLIGLVVVLRRRAAAQSYGDVGDSGQRSEQMDLLLRLVDQLLRAYMDGRTVNPRALRIAAATLLRMDQPTR